VGMGVCAVAVTERAKARRRVFMMAPMGIFAGPPARNVRVRIEHTAPEFRVEKG
jgi:hypothetical protein